MSEKRGERGGTLGDGRSARWWCPRCRGFRAWDVSARTRAGAGRDDQDEVLYASPPLAPPRIVSFEDAVIERLDHLGKAVAALLERDVLVEEAEFEEPEDGGVR